MDRMIESKAQPAKHSPRGIEMESPPAPSHVPDGILILDKPEGITSFGLVARVKKLLGIRKVGHCGTLDPFATGVMILCLNGATRIVDQLLVQDKLYRFTLRLGLETDTLDKMGEVVRSYDGPALSKAQFSGALKGFRGSYLQQVPRYAAVKIEGKRLYALTRKGIDVEPPSREVQIHHLELLDYQWPFATLEAHCSKGTYIRQLAADIGSRLQCGAHVSSLRRLKSGKFGIEFATTLDNLCDTSLDNLWTEKLISMDEALPHLRGMVLTRHKWVKQVRNGTLDPDWEREYRQNFMDTGAPVKLLTPERDLVALWWPHADGRQQRRLRVIGGSR